MIACLITTLLIVQTPTAQPAPNPVRETYILILKNGTELPVFYKERQEMGSGFRVELDTPWQPDTKFIKSDDVPENGVIAETTRKREERIRKGWAAHNYTEVNGRYYPTAEVELAKRARDLAGIQTHSPAASAGPAPASSASTEGVLGPELVKSESLSPAEQVTAPPVSPGFLAQFWPHIALIVVALIASAFIVRMLIVGGS